MDWATVRKELQKPLDPAAIKPPPQGKYGEYVEGLHVIREANRIFGEDGWSYEVTRLELVSRVEAKSNGNVRVGYLCGVRANVDGVIREGLAVGNGTAKPDNEADAHESAVKEAETDALKRALRSFGNTFGLALYEKDHSKREVAKPEPTDEARQKWMLEQIEKSKTEGQLNAWWDKPNISQLFMALPQPMQNLVNKAYTDRKAELSPNSEAA